MPDMLVKLYELPEIASSLTALKTLGVEVRRANAWEMHVISEWVGEHFKPGWAVACEVALTQRPVSCFIAVEHDPARDRPAEVLVGFACYDVAAKGIFGPTGVREDRRGKGIGKGLLLASLHAMATEGYAYGIIGRVGPVDFYRKVVGATVIENSERGLARRNLKGRIEG